MIRSMLGFCGPKATFSYVGKASSSSSSLTIPSGAAAGDVCLTFNGCTGLVSTPTSVTPTGFTKIVDQTTTQRRYVHCWKKLVSGDPGSSITGMSDFQQFFDCYVFRPSISTNFAVTNTGFEVTSSNPSSQTVPAGNAPCIIVAHEGSASTNPPTSFASGSFDQEDTGYYCRYGYKIYNTAPSSNVIDMADLGVYNQLATFLVQLA